MSRCRAPRYVLFVLLCAFGSYYAEARISPPGMANVLLWQYNPEQHPPGWPYLEAVKWGRVIGSESISDTDLSSWLLLGSGDFDGDGYGDFLWLNKWSGYVAVWLMKGTLIKSVPTNPLGEVPRLADGSPALALIADMDQDGKSEIIWVGDQLLSKPDPKNPDLGNPDPGNLPPPRYWYSQWRIDLTSSTAVTESSGVTLGHIKAVGQFDGTGGLDLMTTYLDFSILGVRTNFVFADGTSHRGPQVIDSWQVKGAGDFDGNGTTDVLWHQADTGQVDVWEMASGNYVRSHHLNHVPTSIWTIDGIGDLDSNGVSDIIWRRNSDNWLTIWSLGRNFAVLDWGAPGFKLAFPLAGTVATEQRFGRVMITLWHYVSSGTQECPLFSATLADSAGLSKTYGPYGGPRGYSPRRDANGNWRCDNFIHYTGISDTYTITTTRGLRKMITVLADDYASFELCVDGTGCEAPEADLFINLSALYTRPSPVLLGAQNQVFWQLCNRGDATSEPVNTEVETTWKRDLRNGLHSETYWPPEDPANTVRPMCGPNPEDLSCFPSQWSPVERDKRTIAPSQCIWQKVDFPIFAGYWKLSVDEAQSAERPVNAYFMCPLAVSGVPCQRFTQPIPPPHIVPGDN